MFRQGTQSALYYCIFIKHSVIISFSHTGVSHYWHLTSSYRADYKLITKDYKPQIIWACMYSIHDWPNWISLMHIFAASINLQMSVFIWLYQAYIQHITIYELPLMFSYLDVKPWDISSQVKCAMVHNEIN
jgi:hypothetical protein